MTTDERVRTLVTRLGMNVKAFSDMLGYDRPQVMYDVVKGKTRNISTAMCARIMEHVPNLNRIWLLTGEGPMFLDEEQSEEDKLVENLTIVPLVPLSAFAGPISAYSQEGVTLNNCERVVSPTPGAELALPISGDSMEPVFCDGAVVFVKRINEQAFIPWGHAMVLDTENGIFLKKVMPDYDNDSYFWAESYNVKYPPMHVPKVSVKAMYRVLNMSKTYTTM